MENNANINARLIDLLNVLDMRAQVTIFELDENENQHIKFDSCMPVYKLMAALDTDDVNIRKYRAYEVIGLNLGLTTNILIKKGERYYA